MNISGDLRGRLFKAAPLPKTPFSLRPFDTGAINETIERALTSAGVNTQTGPMKGVMDTIQQSLASAGLSRHAPEPPTGRVQPGRFLSRSFTNHAGTRTYKLYVPASYSGEAGKPVPVVVMLHGCTQSPDDFAAGTRMNVLAEQHGFLVIYPAQAASANGSKCWNWFRAEDQRRDRGEPALIAGITQEVAANYHVDERRVFVAGLSSGAAMAVILGTTYPDTYAAIGAHSGLPYGAAHSMASAFGAMKGSPSPGFSGMPHRPGSTAGRTQATRGVPTIVFHGDSDHTVDARNGAAIVEQAKRNYSDETDLQASVRQGTAGGRKYSHTVYADAANQPVVEQWLVHGAGHAWSGGSPNGSFTDHGGPDASAEMIRFFYSQQRSGSA